MVVMTSRTQRRQERFLLVDYKKLVWVAIVHDHYYLAKRCRHHSSTMTKMMMATTSYSFQCRHQDMNEQ